MPACACRKRYAPNELHTTRGVLGPESRLEITGDEVDLVLKGEKLEVAPGFTAGEGSAPQQARIAASPSVWPSLWSRIASHRYSNSVAFNSTSVRSRRRLTEESAAR